MVETFIPADLSNICNAEVAARHIEGLVNVALREQVFNYGNAMRPPPVGGVAELSIAIGPAVPTAAGLQVQITAEARFIYSPISNEEARSCQPFQEDTVGASAAS